jgi:hypothetical protein
MAHFGEPFLLAVVCKHKRCNIQCLAYLPTGWGANVQYHIEERFE